MKIKYYNNSIIISNEKKMQQRERQINKYPKYKFERRFVNIKGILMVLFILQNSNKCNTYVFKIQIRETFRQYEGNTHDINYYITNSNKCNTIVFKIQIRETFRQYEGNTHETNNREGRHEDFLVSSSEGTRWGKL